MRVQTECGHTYNTPWTSGFLLFAPFFDCLVCGVPQTVPLDAALSGEYIETRNANEYYAEQGWPLVPTTTTEDLDAELS